MFLTIWLLQECWIKACNRLSVCGIRTEKNNTIRLPNLSSLLSYKFLISHTWLQLAGKITGRGWIGSARNTMSEWRNNKEKEVNEEISRWRTISMGSPT